MKLKNSVLISGTRDCLHNLKAHFCKVNSSPILVFGTPKSGTTIIAYLIAEATKKSYTADLIRAIPDAALSFQLEYQLLSIDSIVNKYRLEFSRGVIKEPALSPYANRFIDHFPDAYPVFVFRDPRDNIRSILNRLQIPGDLRDLVPEEWDEIKRTPAWKLSILDSWKRSEGQSGNYISTLARNWNAAFEQYWANSSRFYMLRYEDFLADKAGAIERLCVRMGQPVAQDVAALVNKQMQTKGDANTNLIEFFGKDNLRAIEQICQRGIAELGYPQTITP